MGYKASIFYLKIGDPKILEKKYNKRVKLGMQVMVAVVAAGASSAAFMAELGKNGNSHAKWNKICDKFERFCHHGGGALIPSFIALLLFLLISAISIITLHNQKLATLHHDATP